ncbi:hypothetical protein [Yoonia algicola]|uniref:Uncharacterized protein n=1 Tax=Yoonia algicola TaxID=3137368 RepID=A0AAN0MCX1_9RHOB
MRGWLAYSGAFVCGVGAMLLCYLAGFLLIMSADNSGMGSLVLFVVVLPMTASLVAFALAYYGMTGRKYSLNAWTCGAAFVALATLIFTALIIQDTLEEVPAAVSLVVVLYFGGGVMIQRATNG